MASLKDKAVLNAIFNPHSPFADINNNVQDQNDEEINDVNENHEKIKMLEILGIKAAECGKFTESVEFFSNAINLNKKNASAYNNLAQVYRLKGDIEKAVECLEKAIFCSRNQIKSRRQALCQRALIYRLNGDEKNALADLNEAAKLGSLFAKDQLVKMNPYSALCNQMLTEMINKLRNGQLEY